MRAEAGAQNLEYDDDAGNSVCVVGNFVAGHKGVGVANRIADAWTLAFGPNGRQPPAFQAAT